MFRSLTVALALLAVAGTARADYEEGGQLYAVQGRKYFIQHEFTLGVGTLPMDAWYKGYTGTFGYTYHFDDQWAWEIVQATYSINVETSLRDQLNEDFQLQPTDNPEVKAFGNSNLVWKPLYGKLAFLNDTLIYGEAFLTGGGAVARYVNPDGLEENASIHPGFDAGAGFRVYLSESFAMRFDTRYLYFFRGGANQAELFLNLGLGLNIK